jgi:cyclopropane-fatty-acyl-phospholipid synthase
MGIRLWNGNSFSVGVVGSSASCAKAPCVLLFRHPAVVCALILGRDPLRLAEAYFQSDVYIEGDLFAALDLKDHLESLQIPVRDRLKAAMAALQLRALNPRKSHRLGENVPSHRRQMRTHSKADNLKASRFHTMHLTNPVVCRSIDP